MKRRKVWVGLGTAILVTPHTSAMAEAPRPMLPVSALAGTAPDSGRTILAQARAKSGGEGEGHGHAVRTKPRGSGGEGGEGRAGKAKAPGGEGEGGEGGGAKDSSLDPPLRFYRDIQLIRGHLLVGDELVNGGRWKEALPHFLHPSEEIYGKIGSDLKTYGVPPFVTALKALAQTVKARNKEAYAGAFKAVGERLAAADQSLRGKQDNWPHFAVEAALETLRSAADEYGEAVEGGKIGNVVEYQDSRGFVWQAERLFAGVADDLAKKDADAVAAIRAAFADLKGAWPGAMPPPKPAKDLSAVLSDISKIELQLGRFR